MLVPCKEVRCVWCVLLLLCVGGVGAGGGAELKLRLRRGEPQARICTRKVYKKGGIPSFFVPRTIDRIRGPHPSART